MFRADMASETEEQIGDVTLLGHTEAVTGAMWAQDDKELVSVGIDKTVRVWDVEKLVEKSRPIYYTARLNAVTVDDESKRMICGSTDGCSIVFDYRTQIQTMQMRNGGPITDVAVDRTGFRIAAVSDVNCELNVWDLRNRNCLARMQNVHRSMPTSCEFTPDNRSIITTSTDGSVKSIDYECGRALITLRDHKHAVSSACLTTDGRLLATTSWDRSILLYDLQTGAYRNQGPTVLTGAHQGSISCSSMSAAGDILVTGGLDKLIIVWDPDKGHHVLSLNGHKDWVNTVKISTDERVVLSASKDKTIRLWDVLSRERMTTGTMVDTHAKVNKSKCSLCEKYFVPNPLEKRTGRPRCAFCRLETEPSFH